MIIFFLNFWCFSKTCLITEENIEHSSSHQPKTFKEIPGSSFSSPGLYLAKRNLKMWFQQKKLLANSEFYSINFYPGQTVTKCVHDISHPDPLTTVESLHKVVSSNAENSLELTFMVWYNTQGYGVAEHSSNYSSDLSERNTERDREKVTQTEREVGRQLLQIKLSTDDREQLDTVNKIQFSNSEMERRAPYIQ